MISLNLNYVLKALPPTAVTLEIKASNMNYGMEEQNSVHNTTFGFPVWGLVYFSSTR